MKFIKPPRIAIFCTGFPVPTETFILNQVVALLNFDCKVDIFPYRKWPSLNGDYLAYQLEKSVFPAIIPPSNLVRRFNAAIRLAISYRAYWRQWIKTLNPFLLGRDGLNLTVFFSSIVLLGKPQYDLLIAHFGENGIGAEKLKRCGFIKAPLLTVFHGYDMHWPKDRLSGIKASYKNLFNNGNFFIVNSGYGYEKLMKLGCSSERTFIVPAGFPAAEFNLQKNINESTSTILLLSVGRLLSLKGHALAIEALFELYKSGIRNWKYSIAGSGPEMNNLQLSICEKGLGNHVILLGDLPYAEVVEKLAVSDIFIHPSITDETGRAEAQGLAIQEAQAMGLAVIAFHSGGIADGVPPGTGLLVPEGDVSLLAKELEKLINDPDLRHSLGGVAQIWAKENYNVLKLTGKLLEITGISV
jgi:colanic acid/amylovoran biosynthesis glycosyltransferase